MLSNSQHIEPCLSEGKILECVVTTLNGDGTPNIAPMGPIVDDAFTKLLLRPFRSATTYRNLKRDGQGVLHVTDDVELIARTAVGQLQVAPKMARAESVDGVVLADACRWYAFRVETINDQEERADIAARIVDQGRLREFFGFNRAKHAVIEAAILATRVNLLSDEVVLNDMERLAIIVMKTGGHQERRAFEFLREFIDTSIFGGNANEEVSHP